MNEGDFVNKLVKGFLSYNSSWWLHKFDNTAKGQVKPCDLIGSYYGKAVGIECKLHKGKRDFETLNKKEAVVLRMNDFRPTQPPSLNRMASRHVKVIIALAVYDEKKRLMEAFAFPWKYYLEQFPEGDLTFNFLKEMAHTDHPVVQLAIWKSNYIISESDCDKLFRYFY